LLRFSSVHLAQFISRRYRICCCLAVSVTGSVCQLPARSEGGSRWLCQSPLFNFSHRIAA
jgi:hypothetical protein